MVTNECPYCGDEAGVLVSVRREYGEKVFVYYCKSCGGEYSEQVTNG